MLKDIFAELAEIVRESPEQDGGPPSAAEAALLLLTLQHCRTCAPSTFPWMPMATTDPAWRSPLIHVKFSTVAHPAGKEETP